MYNKPVDDSPYISFNVVDESAVASRSGEDDITSFRDFYPLTAEGCPDTLYLIEYETQGINIDRNAATPSRGQAVGNTNTDKGADRVFKDTDTLGIYAFPTPAEGATPDAATALDFDNRKLKIPTTGYGTLLDEAGKPEQWRDYPLDFVAYYPYTTAFEYVAPKDNEGNPIPTTSEESDYIDNLYSWIWTPGRNGLCMHPTPRHGMYLYYKVPPKVEDQQDFMATYVAEKQSGTCQLKMRHMLTAIRFVTGDELRVRDENDENGNNVCTIKKISLSGVRYSGYMSVMQLKDNGSVSWVVPEKKEGDNAFITDLKNNSLKLTSYSFEPGAEPGAGFTLPESKENPGMAESGISLTGENQTLLLLPQELGENASLHIEFEYRGFTFKRTINFKGKTWKPGVTITYKLNGELAQLPFAELELLDENGLHLEEIKVGYAGGETDYKVASYLYYKDDNGIKKYPMPWKASIVTLDYSKPDEDGNPAETTIISYVFPKSSIGVFNGAVENKRDAATQAAYDKEFGSIERIEFDRFNNNNPATLAAMKDNPVKTFVMIPKIVMEKTSSATGALRDAAEVGTKAKPFNLASRGIGLADNIKHPENHLEIFHKNGMGGGVSLNDWTDNLTREYTYTNESYGDEDINTANCYIVSAPGWYTIPLVYGNAVKDGCINYSAYVSKSNNHGESKSPESLNGENQILKYAIRHDGERIYSPYILDSRKSIYVTNNKTHKNEWILELHENYPTIDPNNIEAKLLWEDQICLIEDVSLVNAGDQTLDMFYSEPPSLRTVQQTYSPKKKIKFHIQKDNIRQGNAVIVLKEKDKEVTNTETGKIEVKKGPVIWSWHIWVTPDGTGQAYNYHPTSHKSTIYGKLFESGGVRTSWTEIHNHYIYNRCIGLVMAGDELKFTPPNVCIKYEPLYEAMTTLLTKSDARYIKDYGFTQMSTTAADAYVNEMKAYFKNNPVYVKVSQDGLNCKVDEDYYMLYQWGRKDPMISRFESVYDGNHCRIEPTDKRHLGEHSDITEHKEWIKYGIQHPDEFMWNGGITGGNFYANLWNLSLGTDEINSMYPGPTNEYYKLTAFYSGDSWMPGAKYILTSFYFTSDRVFKSVYDPSPVGQKMPVGPVLNMLVTNTDMLTKDADQYTYYYYEYAPYTDYGHTATGVGGKFTECKKDADGNYITPLQADYSSAHTFWIPAFGYRFGDGFTKKHGNDFAIWEGGALSHEGKGRVLHGNNTRVLVWGRDNNSPFIYAMGLPVLPIFEEPQWLRSF